VLVDAHPTKEIRPSMLAPIIMFFISFSFSSNPELLPPSDAVRTFHCARTQYLSAPLDNAIVTI